MYFAAASVTSVGNDSTRSRYCGPIGDVLKRNDVAQALRQHGVGILRQAAARASSASYSGCPTGCRPSATGTGAGFAGTSATPSNPRAKPRRLPCTPTPASAITASNAARPNGNASVAHNAPNSTDDTTLPACSASAAMSNATNRCAAARPAAVTAPEVRRSVARCRLLRNREGPMRRGDQQRSVRRHQSALDRPPGLHPLRSNNDIHVPRRRHSGKHWLAPWFGPDRFDIVDRCAGPLGYARHAGRLRSPSFPFGQRDDPVDQDAAALTADCQHRDRNRPVHHTTAGRRRCNQPMTAPRIRASVRSRHCGFSTTSAR